jgi:mRNA interferase RelE/StbE
MSLAKRFEVRYTPAAARAIRRLDADLRAACGEAIRRLATDPARGKRLRGGLQGLWCYRTGDYRIVYELRARQLVILVVGLGHRRDVYERLKRRLR